jgi:hypothetical protein
MNTTKTTSQKLAELKEKRQQLLMKFREEKAPNSGSETHKQLKATDEEIKNLEFKLKIEQIETELQHIEECIKFVPEIEKVLNKFNLKKSGKRFKDAIAQIDKNLYWYCKYNSWIIEHLQYNIAIVHACITSFYGDGVEQNGVINAEIVIQELKKFVEYNTKRIEEARKQNNIETINKFREEKENLLKQIEQYNKSMQHDIYDKFDLYIHVK